MRCFWIFFAAVLLVFGPTHAIAQQPDPASAQTQQQAAPQPPVSEKAAAPAQTPAATLPDGPEKNEPAAAKKPRARSDNPFPMDDAPTAPIPHLENLPNPQAGSQTGWSSSLDKADSALVDSSSQDDTSPPPVTALDLEIRAKEDVKIGRYYASIGNWKGALGRFQTAFQNAKDDEDAVCGLAEAEHHLGFSNEAILHYSECLHLDPTGSYSKSAQKALKKLVAHQ